MNHQHVADKNFLLLHLMTNRVEEEDKIEFLLVTKERPYSTSKLLGLTNAVNHAKRQFLVHTEECIAAGSPEKLL